MGKKQETEHTDIQDANMAPDYMQPYLNISDLQYMKFIKLEEASGEQTGDICSNSMTEADESLHANIQKYLSQEDEKAGLTEKEWEVTKEVYMNSYNNWYDPSSEELNEYAEKKYNDLKKREDRAARQENRFAKDYENDKELKSSNIENFIKYKKQEESDTAAGIAQVEALQQIVGAEKGERVTQGVKEKQKEAETQNAMMEALEYLQAVSFEYLTRGALLMCTGGAVCRHLNLPQDHGFFYGEEDDPVVNKNDCQVGDAFHITNFGTCSGSNPPDKKVVMEDMVTTDESGLKTQAQDEDTVDRGFQCIPEIVEPGWINTFPQTKVGEEGIEAVSTKSFLVCIHGGMIYPINSGQHSVLQNLLKDSEIKKEFDSLCAGYQSLKEEEKDLKKKLSESQIYPNMSSYAAIGGMRETPDMIEAKLKANARKQRTYENEIGFCMDRARDDSYQRRYDNIPEERRETMDYMLNAYSELFEEDKSSIKRDYYAHRRRYGYNSQSAYANDAPGYETGSDAYVDWRAARTEQKSGKDAAEEYKAWSQEVDERGYDTISAYEKEEFDRAAKIYGK